jgi:hypothetical protein
MIAKAGTWAGLLVVHYARHVLPHLMQMIHRGTLSSVAQYAMMRIGAGSTSRSPCQSLISSCLGCEKGAVVSAKSSGEDAVQSL